MKMTDPIKSKKDVRRLKGYYLKKENKSLRNYLLIVMGLYTAYRISDILELKWSDVLERDGTVVERITIREKKTKKYNSAKVNKALEKAILLFAAEEKDKKGYIFKGGRDKNKPLHRTQAYRIVKTAVNALGIKGNISCHSLRKTVGYHMYLKGTSQILLMKIYNHSSFEITKRYLCIDQLEKDEVFLALSYA